MMLKFTAPVWLSPIQALCGFPSPLKKAKPMAFISSKAPVASVKTALCAAAILLISGQGHADPGPDGPFSGLSGHWSGSGTITMRNGGTERIRCRASYAVNGTGRAIQQSLRCASDSYKLEISANVMAQGGAISGSWSEATRNAQGTVSGHASAGVIHAIVQGPGFSAGLDIVSRGERQTVGIRIQGDTDVAGVSIALRKG